MLRGIRVYELARELGISSKEILRLLADEMNIEMNNHMATLNDQVVAKLRRLVAERQGGQAVPLAAPLVARQPGAPASAPTPAAPAVRGALALGTPVAAQGPQREVTRPLGEPRPTPSPEGRRAPVRAGTATSARPSQPGRPGPRPGAVHFHPAPGLLPLVTPRPTPPRPRRATVARPEPVAPAAEPERPSAPPAEPLQAAPEAAVPPHVETPVASVASPPPPLPNVQAPPMAAEAPPTAAVAAVAPVEPHVAVPPEPLPGPQPAAPAASSPPTRPAMIRPATSAPAASAMPSEPRPGLLAIRRVTPGAPPALREPDRPLLAVRKAEPRAARPAAGFGPAPAGGATTGPATAVDRTARGRRDGHRAPGTGTEADIRRRGGAGRRPARPGGAAFGEGDAAARRRGRRRGRRLHSAAEAAAQLTPPTSIALEGPVVVSELAELLRVSAPEIIRKLLAQGVMAAINQQLEVAQARAIASEFGVEVEGASAEVAESPVDRATVGALLARDDPQRRAERPPVVTVLGHVDHGKTTLLDSIRSARVAAGEAGGITQHIGAYVVHRGDRQVVFLDTPGHEAFTAMRARGAQVTDIAVLVVAADDGVMPQTLEALSHARAAGVPIVVALNKIDKANANPERVLQQLADHGLVPEEWGGETIVCPVSALKGQGIDHLLEMLLLVADLQELRADPQRHAVGTIIEAEVARGRGPVATVLVQSGTLRLGDTFVSGQVYGRVRAMVSDLGRPVREAGPSTPVEVLGFDAIPGAGDAFQVLAEREARDLAALRQDEHRRDALSADRAVSLADFRQEGEPSVSTDLKIILKTDVQGSLEAVRGSLEKLHNEEARVVLLHGGVGPVNESDVMLAAASGASILGFNVRPDAGAEREAQRVGVAIQTHRIIYEMLDVVQKALDGRLKPRTEIVTLGHAEVRKTIRVPDIGVIAGSYVTDGVVRRGAACRLLRGGTIVYEGTITSLRRFKDDAREVAAGYECGIGLERFSDIKEGDVIEVTEERELPR